MTGETIAHFRVLDKLGGGGMGVVYAAQDTRLKRAVALKFLPPHLSTDEEAKRRFEHEAQTASALNHPNICTIYDIGETEDGQMFIAMAQYDGQTLKKRLQSGAMSVEETTAIVAQVAEGLAVAHEKGIIHRDIKPANILLTDRGRAVILDFGLAKLVGALDLTKSGSTLGTAHYMSPEQARADEVDQRTDLWSLGVIMFEMLTGQLPFQGGYEQAIVYAILNEEPNSLRELRPDVPDDPSELVERLLAKDPSDRISTASEVVSALAGVARPSAVSSAPSTAAQEEPLVPPRLAAVAAVILLIAAGIFLWTKFATPDDAREPLAALDAVVVLPFDVQAGEDLQYLSRGMVTMISPMIDGLGTLRAVDQRAVLGWVDQQNDTYIDPEDGKAIAGHFAAGRYVLGSILQAGPAVQLSASLYGADGSIESEAAASYRDESELLGAVDALLQQLFSGAISRPDFALTGLVGNTTTSFAAMKAYVQAEQAIRNSNGFRARELAAEAVTHDSTFALGWYMRGRAHAFNGDVDAAAEYYRIAKRHASNASARVRALIEARLATTEGRDGESIATMERLVERYPDDIETTGLLGDTYYHGNPIVGRPAAAAIPLFERVLRYDPDNGEYLGHLSALYARERKWQSLDSLYRAVHGRANNAQVETLEGIHAFHFGDSVVRDSVVAARRRGSSGNAAWLAFHLDMGEMIRELVEYFEAVTNKAGPDLRLAGGQSGSFELAEGYRVLGQPDRANAVMAKSSNPGRAQYYAVLGCCHPYLPSNPDSLARYRSLVTQWDTVAVPLTQAALHLAGTSEFHRDMKAHLLGVIAERQGDKRYLYELASDLASQSAESALTLAVIKELRARALLLDGRPAEALAAVDSATFHSTWIVQTSFSFANGYQRRFLKARALYETGRYEEAARWAGSVHDGFQMWMFELLPSTLLLQAESYANMGDADRAIERYDRFLELWSDAEQSLQPVVNDVRRARERLLDDSVRDSSE